MAGGTRSAGANQGRSNRRGLVLGVILAAFVVLLVLWLLASGNDASEGAPASPAVGTTAC